MCKQYHGGSVHGLVGMAHCMASCLYIRTTHLNNYTLCTSFGPQQYNHQVWSRLDVRLSRKFKDEEMHTETPSTLVRLTVCHACSFGPRSSGDFFPSSDCTSIYSLTSSHCHTNHIQLLFLFIGICDNLYMDLWEFLTFMGTSQYSTSIGSCV